MITDILDIIFTLQGESFAGGKCCVFCDFCPFSRKFDQRKKCFGLLAKVNLTQNVLNTDSQKLNWKENKKFQSCLFKKF